MQVTDEMVEAALCGYWEVPSVRGLSAYGIPNEMESMRRALQAVSDHIANAGKPIVKEEKKYYGHIDAEGNCTFPHETKQEEKPYRGRTIKTSSETGKVSRETVREAVLKIKKEKEQTLLEYAEDKVPNLKNPRVLRQESWILTIISEYLERLDNK